MAYINSLLTVLQAAKA